MTKIKHSSFLLVACLLASICHEATQVDGNVVEEFIKSLNGGDETKFDFVKIVDKLLLDILPLLFGQKSSNESGNYDEVEDFAMNDKSNDDITHASTQDIIKRSGYKYENHFCESDDGYITQLTRIVNPLVKRKYLKKPPVLFLHGATIDERVYIWASAIQHHPEKYPRRVSDGPITSWNRSIAFTLANNGYDVWLAGTRGANVQSRVKNPLKTIKNALTGPSKDSNMTTGENLVQLVNSPSFWSFTLDHIIEYEIPKQIETVLEITGSKNLTLITYSQSTFTSLAMLGLKEKLAKEKIHNYICMAPVINYHGTNFIMKYLIKNVIINLPDEMGHFVTVNMLATQPMRELILALANSKLIRYSLVKGMLLIPLGPSGKYRTLLELPVLGNLMKKLSFSQLKHYAQMFVANRFQKYDYGKIQNHLIYGNEIPPAYNLSNIHVKNWLVISAENDNLGTKESVDQVLNEVRPKPIGHIVGKGMNHLDLVAAVDNDIHVNLPLVRYLDKYRIRG